MLPLTWRTAGPAIALQAGGRSSRLGLPILMRPSIRSRNTRRNPASQRSLGNQDSLDSRKIPRNPRSPDNHQTHRNRASLDSRRLHRNWASLDSPRFRANLANLNIPDNRRNRHILASRIHMHSSFRHGFRLGPQDNRLCIRQLRVSRQVVQASRMQGSTLFRIC